MSSNLPPGVTQGMIDRYYSGPCQPCEDGDHDKCEDLHGTTGSCRCEDCDQAAIDAADDVAYEAWKESRWEDEQTEPEFDYGPDD